MKNLVAFGAFYLCVTILGVQVIAHADAARADYERVYEHFTPGNRADAQFKGWLETLTFGWYRGATAQDNQLEAWVMSAERHERAAERCAWGIALLSFLQLAMTALQARSKTARWISRPLVIQLLGVSMVFLIIGLLAPILSFVAYTDVAVLGTVVFKYEAKGILTSVYELLGSGNVFIAILLFLFSVVTPFIKHLFAFLALSAKKTSHASRFIGWLAAIGKWSMVDVLVVAILLSFFISRSEEFTDSWLGQGLYFFAGYCVLSLLAVQCMGTLHQRRSLEQTTR